MTSCASQAFAGIVTVSVGHCHPEVVAAVEAQNRLLQHTTTIYLNNQIAEYAKELTDRLPGNLKVFNHTSQPPPWPFPSPQSLYTSARQHCLELL